MAETPRRPPGSAVCVQSSQESDVLLSGRGGAPGDTGPQARSGRECGASTVLSPV